VPGTDEQHPCGPDGGGHADKQRPLTGLNDVLDSSPHAGSEPAVESACLVLLRPEGADHPRRTECFLDDRHRPALKTLDPDLLEAEPAAVYQRDEQEWRRDGQRHQRQRPVDARGHVEHRHQREGAGHEGCDRVRRHPLHSSRVVLDPVGGIARTPCVVVGERKTLQVPEEARAEVEHHALPRSGLQHERRHALQLGQEGDQDEHRGGRHEQCSIRALDRSRRKRTKEGRQRVRAKDGIHRHRQRNRDEQGQGGRKQAQQEEPSELEPEGPYFTQHSPQEGEIGVPALAVAVDPALAHVLPTSASPSRRRLPTLPAGAAVRSS
jgi:hypothetical protein